MDSQLAVNPMREVWVRQNETLGLAYGERWIARIRLDSEDTPATS